MKVLDIPVLIVRGEDMRIRAFINACTHRGRAITQTHDEKGKLKAFSCPYHAWRFGTDGRIAHDCRPAQVRRDRQGPAGSQGTALRRARGFCVGVYHRGRRFDIDDYLGDMLHELAGLEADKWFLHGTCAAG
jgi:phenylpropionate dioxygenase-like ring-hydroxylating dioxygenase large terminal subunit